MRDAELLGDSARCDLDSDESLERGLREVWIHSITYRLHEGCWDEEEIFFFVPDECLRTPESIC